MAMTYELWMSETASFARARSKELKAVDEALKAWRLAEKNSSGSVLMQKKTLQQALESWKAAQKAKGQDWRTSVRNQKKAVEKLTGELGHVITGTGGLNSRGEIMLDAKELMALKAVSDAIKQNTRKMFAGQKLTTKTAKGLADLNDVRGALSTFKGAAKDIKGAATGTLVTTGLNDELKKLLASLFGESTAAEAQAALGPLFADFLTSATPFVGAISSGAKAVKNWASAAKTLYDKWGMAEASGSFAPGDPAAAFDAVLLIMNREATAFAATASIQTVAAGAKAAFTAADFGALSGPILGAAESLALVVQKIYLFARDWKEMKAANLLLEKGVCDFGLFKTCPLLGCYLIANSDTSAIINMAVADYGKTNWKLEVEMMVRKAKPVFEKSRTVIAGARFECAGMKGMKGQVVNRNATTLGLPTGKLDGFLDDISKKVGSVTA
jgi:hypothetical protein